MNEHVFRQNFHFSAKIHDGNLQKDRKSEKTFEMFLLTFVQIKIDLVAIEVSMLEIL